MASTGQQLAIAIASITLHNQQPGPHRFSAFEELHHFSTKLLLGVELLQEHTVNVLPGQAELPSHFWNVVLGEKTRVCGDLQAKVFITRQGLDLVLETLHQTWRASAD